MIGCVHCDDAIESDGHGEYVHIKSHKYGCYSGKTVAERNS